MINIIKYGLRWVTHPIVKQGLQKTRQEFAKTPKRYEIINYLLKYLKRKTTYLEIGVRNPDDNFNKIKSDIKYSVDPGVEFEKNPVDFKLTSDDFFDQLRKNQVLENTVLFDVIFIDGLHLAEQVDRDIANALEFIKPDGFVVLHDCNPPTEWHAREEYNFNMTPAKGLWNGTTWKAFVKWRTSPKIQSCCIDTDWGIGILSKKHPLGDSTSNDNSFYEYKSFEKEREKLLNLIDFEQLKEKLLN